MTTSFENFDVYKKSVVLTKFVFELLNMRGFEKEFAFRDQIKRAVISITNNIAEGSEYNNNKQFIRFLRMSKGSCAEVRNLLLLSKELNFCEETDIKQGYELTVEISQNLSNFIKYLSVNIKD